MANEKRLIDANDVIRKLRKELDEMEPVDFWEDALATYKKRIIPRLIFNVITYIERQPTVDAVEVVHGRWETANDGTHFCSHCGCDAPYTWDEIDRNFINSADDVPDRPSNYCSNCGAKMDGEAV